MSISGLEQEDPLFASDFCLFILNEESNNKEHMDEFVCLILGHSERDNCFIVKLVLR